MILVTGPSGNIGTAVVEQLAAKAAEVRIARRDPASVLSTRAGMAVRFDFLDQSTFGPAVDGCDSVFLMRPPAISNTKATLNVFIDVARRRGVKHIVFISVAGAGRNPLVPHHAVERHLQAGRNDWTILRPGIFAQNLGEAYRDDVRHDHRIFLPAGRASVAFVDARDIGEVAADILVDPVSHLKQIYSLTGASAHTFAEVCAFLTEELGRPIRYEPAPIPSYAAHLHRRGLPIGQVAVLTLLHVGLRFGQGKAADGDLRGLLARSPGSLRTYIHDRRATWL